MTMPLETVITMSDESTAEPTPEAGRRCAYPGCVTTLSRYNSDYLCWTHADVKTRAQFDNLTRRTQFFVPSA
jgi:hypothetical protein